MKKIIVFVLTGVLMICLVACGNQSPTTEKPVAEELETGKSGLTLLAEEDRDYWAEFALDPSSVTTQIACDLFYEDFEEALKAESVDDVSADVKSLFGYLYKNYDEGTVARYIADLGWEAIDALYRGDKEEYVSKMEEAKAELDYALASDTSTTDNTTEVAPSKNIEQLVSDDEYATIWFTGIELSDRPYDGQYNVCFIVENKTDYQLIVRVDSISVDGWSLTDPFVFEEIAQHSKAHVKIPTDDLESTEATTLSGTLTLSDKSYELWGTLVREYPFNFTVGE